MASSNRGVPSTLIRPLQPEPEADAPADPPVAEGDESGLSPETQGRGEPRPAPSTRSRRRVARPSEKTSKRGLHLADGVWERLQLEAIRKRTTVSAVANEVLERNLARLRIERDA